MAGMNSPESGPFAEAERNANLIHLAKHALALLRSGEFAAARNVIELCASRGFVTPTLTAACAIAESELGNLPQSRRLLDAVKRSIEGLVTGDPERERVEDLLAHMRPYLPGGSRAKSARDANATEANLRFPKLRKDSKGASGAP